MRVLSRWKINERARCRQIGAIMRRLQQRKWVQERKTKAHPRVRSPATLVPARTTRLEWLCKYYMILQFTSEPCAFVSTNSQYSFSLSLSLSAVFSRIIVKPWFNYEKLETSFPSVSKESWLRHERNNPRPSTDFTLVLLHRISSFRKLLPIKEKNYLGLL